ncbi:MAG: hypothetical protein RL294_1165 [Actinomycetota bacterium]|jgi:hypothetical protein
MTYSPTRRFLIAIGQILFITATSLSVPLWPTQPASATIASPSSLSSTSAPAGLIINSPWVLDTSGTEWAYGTTSASMGTLISRNRTTGAFTSREIIAGDEGSIAGLYSPLSNVAVFSARRTGLGNRITAFDLATGTRISSRTLAPDETLIRALAFTSGADSYIVGTNQNPAKVMKFATTTGALEYSSTLATGLKEITAFIPNGTELLAVVNTDPIKLVSVTRNRLVVGSVVSLPTGTPTLMDPVVVGTTAFLGTDATPGRITAIDIPTKTVIGSATLNSGEIGARNLVVDDSTGTLYATTDSAAGPRIASFQLTDLRRLGMTQLSAGSSATSLLLSGENITVGFSGTRGVETFTVAPEPNAPVITGIQEADSAVTVAWNSGGSVEPIIDYTASVAAGTFSASCSTNGTTCTIRGLNNGTTYSISVVARSVAGVSQATLTSGVPRTVPDAPSTPRVTRGNADVTVTWTPQGDGGVPIMGYRATASPSGQMCESIVQSCTISGLPNGIPQTVRVVAHNSVGTSQPSAPSASVTPATTPSTPRIESARRTNRGAVIVWEPPTDNGGDNVVSYLVHVTQGSNIVSESTTADTSITLDGLTNGVIYRIVVSATNTVGTGGPSEHAEVIPATVPDPPLAIIARRQSKGADVSWSPAAHDGGDPITGYRVQVRNGNERATSFITTESPYSIRGLMNGNTYAVTVNAINSVGDSVASETAHVTPATVPDPPTSLHATATERGAELEWSAAAHDGGDPITGYRVRIWREATIAAEFDQSTTSASVPGLTTGVAYRVTVTSVNSLGESVASEPAFVTPISPPVVDPPVVDPPPTFGPPSPPVDVAVIGTTRKNVTVGWRPEDSGGAPVIDFIVHVSRSKNRGFAVWPDSTSAIPTVELPKPRRGKLYVRVITVTVRGESAPSQVTLVARARN